MFVSRLTQTSKAGGGTCKTLSRRKCYKDIQTELSLVRTIEFRQGRFSQKHFVVLSQYRVNILSLRTLIVVECTLLQATP